MAVFLFDRRALAILASIASVDGYWGKILGAVLGALVSHTAKALSLVRPWVVS